MPFPLVAVGLIAGASAVGTGANLYSQYRQRELYRYQRGGYERQLRDWHKNVPNRQIRYPEFSYPGHIRSLDTGISQSYAGSLGAGSSLVRNLSSGYGYARSSGLFGKTPSRTSRWL